MGISCALPRLARSPPWIQGSQVHQTHQALDTLAVDLVSPILELVAHPPAAVERPLQVNLVDESHQRQIRLADRLGMVVRARARNVEQLAPPRLGQPMLCVNLRPALGSSVAARETWTKNRSPSPTDQSWRGASLPPFHCAGPRPRSRRTRPRLLRPGASSSLNLIGVNVELLGQLSQSALTLQRCQCYLRLEG